MRRQRGDLQRPVDDDPVLGVRRRLGHEPVAARAGRSRRRGAPADQPCPGPPAARDGTPRRRHRRRRGSTGPRPGRRWPSGSAPPARPGRGPVRTPGRRWSSRRSGQLTTHSPAARAGARHPRTCSARSAAISSASARGDGRGHASEASSSSRSTAPTGVAPGSKVSRAPRRLGHGAGLGGLATAVNALERDQATPGGHLRTVRSVLPSAGWSPRPSCPPRSSSPPTSSALPSSWPSFFAAAFFLAGAAFFAAAFFLRVDGRRPGGRPAARRRARCRWTPPRRPCAARRWWCRR